MKNLLPGSARCVLFLRGINRDAELEHGSTRQSSKAGPKGKINPF
jgi:hypothetical protein